MLLIEMHICNIAPRVFKPSVRLMNKTLLDIQLNTVRMSTDELEIGVAPDCPRCGIGNTWTKDQLTRDFYYEEANCWCKNCRTEFFAPPRWFAKDDYEDQLKSF